ncbi:homoserine dehydrogenase [Metallosphaera tengchongensis]|uniref:Homoserine dehydrogenase n=1 Tax=Metallosphaera tengchongensis TaxID=1532350 RepID=A0A6N0NWZ2_9CREN|nr:homoserine dehydrogenase [Metallosphaera tengchongensis]QKQ99639.1 homoserine dehydrogenase [Metallosphaera tengchongensis]
MKALMLGYGNVGKALNSLIRERSPKLGLDIKVEGVVTRRGIMLNQREDFHPDKEGTVLEALDLINPDLVIDVSSANYEDGEPSLSLYLESLSRGINVVTANKAPLALNFSRIMAVAEKNGAKVGFQATVMSGTPSINLLRAMRAAEVRKIRGILNGTTNYILTRMNEGLDYLSALKEAQRRGYAETDPEHDVNGFDAAAKLTILANFALKKPVTLKDVEFSGIKDVTQDKVKEAARKGKKIKLIANAGEGSLRVMTSEISPEDPLYHVDGVTNALDVHTDVQEVVIIGPGAGPLNAAFGVFSDIVLMYKGTF